MKFSEEFENLIFSSNPKFGAEPQPYQSELKAIDSLATSLNSDSLNSELESPQILPIEVDNFPKAIVFVDSSVKDYSILSKTVSPGTEVRVLDSAKDGVTQITELLSQRQGVTEVHILSHGQSGSLTLGAANLSLESLDNYERELSKWSDSLTEEADLLLYGCNVAQGEKGRAFVEQLSYLSSADVAASIDITGGSILGGNWELESTTGAIEASLPFDSNAIDNYNWILPSYVDGGNPVNIVEVGEPWTQGNGFLEQSGVNNFLYAGETIPAGDFTINSRLSLEELNGTAASFEIDGDRFGFDGNQQRFFTEGDDFGATEFHGNASEFITPGVAFDLTVNRVGEQVSFSIDGIQIVTETLSGSLSNVGFRPWRNTMRLFEFERQDPAPSDNISPSITSNGGGDTAALSVPEEQNSVTTVQASDPDVGDILTYSISGGVDQSLFTIDGTTGVVSFNNTPDFENPGDADGNNVYEVQVQVDDGNGGLDSQDLSITVTDINESSNNPPSITSDGGGDTAALSVPEEQNSVTTVQANDPDTGNILTYSISGGADQTLFTINASTGVLSFTNTPDFENPGDADGNNVYEVQVQVDDGNGGLDSQDLSIIVTDVNESGSTVEYVDGGNPVDIVEVGGAWIQGNGFLEQFGTNKFLYAGETIPAGDFTINSRLSLEELNGTAASFEIDGDRFGFDGNQQRFFTEGDDFGATEFHGNAANFITPGVAFDLTVNRVGEQVSFSINGNQIVTETLSGSLGNVGFRPWRNTMRLFEFERQDPAPSDNISPSINSDGGGDTAALSVPEEQNSVTTVEASDPDGDPLTYSISGGADQSLFTINASTGVLSFTNTPDFENPGDADGNNVYEVQVQVDDGNGGLDSQDLSIIVTDVNESGSTVEYVDGGNPVDIVEVGGAWIQGNGFLEQSGTNKFLYAGEIIPAGDFTINSRLSLEELNGTAASFEIDGDRFGFDGNQQRFFTEGDDFGATEFHGNAAEFITPGVAFDLTVNRVGEQVSFSIDGIQIVTETLSGSLGNVGFRPWRNTMQLFEFEREGAEGIDIFFDQTTVFQGGGTEGYNTFRIPAIVRANNGDLLAFTEGRVDGPDDFGNIDIVMKRSTDDGLTWGPLTVIANNGDLVAGNPSPVVTSQGKVVLVFNTGDRSESELVETGLGAREVFVITSDDNGLTWSNPLNITTSVHRPLAPEIDPNYNFAEDWRWNAVGPGHAIELDNGRLLFGANYKLADDLSRAYTFYSDDGGLSWQIGNISGQPGIASENQLVQLVELENGNILMNARPGAGESQFRRTSISTDNGISWSPFEVETQLPDPTVHGSIIRFTTDPARLLFSNPASQTTRENLTVRLSYDEGNTWTSGKTVDPDRSAYSDLVIQQDNDIGLVHEDSTDGDRNVETIKYTQFNLAWLTDGEDFLTA